MSTRRQVSDNYRMCVTALDDCPHCLGTGIAMKQMPYAGMHRIEIELSVCMCVRVLPRRVEGGLTHGVPQVDMEAQQ